MPRYHATENLSTKDAIMQKNRLLSVFFVKLQLKQIEKTRGGFLMIDKNPSL